MDLENINLIEAIFIVNSYKKSLKELAAKIQKTFTLQKFIYEVNQMHSIAEMLEELNLKYKISKRTKKLTLYNQFDTELQATVILKDGDEHESISYQ